MRWPNRCAWPRGAWYLDLVKRALRRLVPVETAEVADRDRAWHERGGFPVSAGDVAAIGTARHPKHDHDLRGEVFMVRRGNAFVRCAYDYSDYPVVSSAILDSVRVYFKCVAPLGALPKGVVPAGYFPSRPRLVAKGRARALSAAAKRDIDVYARFGTWTDSQGIREMIVERARAGPFRFHGGFGTLVFPAYLKEVLRAKIALDAPGQAPITCRLPEAMALGAVAVCFPPACAFPEPLVDGLHFAAIREDGSDVVDVCRRLLADPAKLRMISGNAAGYFDRNFSPQSIARRILRAALEALAGSRA